MTVLEPRDRHNLALLESVRPAERVNPEPARRYNLVVIGGSTAGLVSAAGAASLGARVAMVERDFLGGDCLVTGCVPSKALIRSGRAMADIVGAGPFGIEASGGADFAAVMEHVRRSRAAISRHDSVKRFEDLGVEVDTIRVDMSDVDRAIVDGDIEGFVKIHLKRGSDRILGATIVGTHAGDLISEVTLAMTHGIGLAKMSAVIHPSPTRAEAIKKAADTYNRGRLTPRLAALLRRWFAWMRS